MASLNASVSFSSNTLFPNPLSLNVSTTEQINGGADIKTITIPADQSAIVYGPSLSADTSGTTYFYAQNTSKSGLVNIYIQPNSIVSASLIATLQPLDFTWIPLAAYNSGLTVTAVNLDGINSSNVSVFWGSRS
jgi:hypothetical protein